MLVYQETATSKRIPSSLPPKVAGADKSSPIDIRRYKGISAAPIKKLVSIKGKVGLPNLSSVEMEQRSKRVHFIASPRNFCSRPQPALACSVQKYLTMEYGSNSPPLVDSRWVRWTPRRLQKIQLSVSPPGGGEHLDVPGSSVSFGPRSRPWRLVYAYYLEYVIQCSHAG